MQSGGYEVKSRVLKLLPTGDIPKVEAELVEYIALLKEHYEHMGIEFAHWSASYIYAQVTAVAVSCDVDDWVTYDVKKKFYFGLDNADSIEQILTLCHNFIIEITNTIFRQKQENNFSPLVQEIRKYIFEYIGEKLTVENIAGHFNYSESHITHRFKEETGMTLGAYILDKRISEAKSMLLQNNAISLISSQLGFCSQSHFTKMFMRQTGVTPYAWRKALLS